MTTIDRALFTIQIEDNISQFLNWGLLEAGAFFNVYLPSSGAYGGSQARLRLSEDPNFTKGRVWDFFRQNLVYETGLEFSSQPIKISGIYVNNSFKPIATTGAYAYHINYPLGRVVFGSAINPSSVVTCEHSFKYYNVTTSNAPWYKEIQLNSWRLDDPQYLRYGSGAWAVPSQIRQQLPAVIVDAGGANRHIPHQLGGGTKTEQEVLFTVLSESPSDKKQMMDAIDSQYQHTIFMYNKNKVFDFNLFPLDVNGMIRPSALMYPNLVEEHRNTAWRKLCFVNTRKVESDDSLPVYQGIVAATVEVHTPEI